MCLSTITSRRTGTDLRVTKVWKEFRVDGMHNGPSSGWFLRSHVFSNVLYPDSDEWIKSTKGLIRNWFFNKKYPKGFHGYDKKPILSADYGCVHLKVEFRRIHTVGTQDGKNVLVAYEMRIPKDWRKYVNV